tara:strand:- start:998 stop:1102 length:105 start_codon:yes stop_codon:yes gene_type:complete
MPKDITHETNRRERKVNLYYLAHKKGADVEKGIL